MKDPKKQLTDYFERLVHRFLNTKSLHLELKRVMDWRRSRDRVEVLNISSYFFELATYSMSRTVLVELASLLSSREDKSLLDWLKKAIIHAKSLEPSRYNPGSSGPDRTVLSVTEYRGVLDGHIAQIDAHFDLISRIKGRRDKAIAHLDKKYFDDPESLGMDYPVRIEEVDLLIDQVSEILREHHVLLLQSDLRMEIVSSGHVDNVLRYARAHQRARTDRNLIDKGYRPVDYERD